MTLIEEQAPAKVNLWLHVTGRRPQGGRQAGMHEIDSLVAFTDATDLVYLEPAHELSLSITGPFAGRLAEEEDNLAIRAAEILANELGKEPNIHIKLVKRLPVSGGIGGGSSDAAAVIRGLLKFWRVDMPPDEQFALGEKLGADVPVCLAARPTLVRGIGDRLSYLPHFPEVPIVMVNPGIGLLTENIFAERSGDFSSPAGFPDNLTDLPALFRSVVSKKNDLTAPAMRRAPVIAEIIDMLKTMEGCQLARMSGSGSTCFGLFTHRGMAARAARMMVAQNPDWWVHAGCLKAAP